MYSARFTRAIEDLLHIEGGFVDHASDPGGATKYGISLRFLRSVHPGATVQAIRALTLDHAKVLYHEHFWSPYKCESLPAPIGEAHFTNVVNMPPKDAGRVLQRAINRAGRKGIAADGIVGPATIAAAHACNQVELRRRIVSELSLHYHNLARQNADFEASFINGWLYRAACLFIQ